MSLPKIYDWQRIRAALKLLADEFPAEFPTWVLIGGGACWFHRESLRAANDPDFRVPLLYPTDEAHWLSKDFMCSDVESPGDLDDGDWIAQAHTGKTADTNFFTSDARFNARLARAIAALTAPEHRALRHWAKHHLPDYTE